MTACFLFFGIVIGLIGRLPENVLYLPLSFLIPSSSGGHCLAAVLAPLAQFSGVPSYLVVAAFQAANGLVNRVTPTSAAAMGTPLDDSILIASQVANFQSATRSKTT